MEDYTNKITFWLENTLSRKEIQACTSLVNPENGILNFVCADRSVSFEYNPYLVSEKEITDSFKRLKIEFSLSPKKIGFMKKWLLKLANENKESFGNQELDCCSMNTKNEKK